MSFALMRNKRRRKSSNSYIVDCECPQCTHMETVPFAYWVRRTCRGCGITLNRPKKAADIRDPVDWRTTAGFTKYEFMRLDRAVEKDGRSKAGFIRKAVMIMVKEVETVLGLERIRMPDPEPTEHEEPKPEPEHEEPETTRIVIS